MRYKCEKEKDKGFNIAKDMIAYLDNSEESS